MAVNQEPQTTEPATLMTPAQVAAELNMPVRVPEEAHVTDPIASVLCRNLHRRHLTVSQRAVAAARAQESYREQAKRRQKEHGRRCTLPEEARPST